LEQARPYTQHNVFLSLLTETGLIGLALFTTLLLLWCYCGWRLWQNGQVPLWARQQGLVMGAFVAAYVANGMFQDVSQIIMVNMLLFFEAGLCLNLYLNSKYQLERQAT
jgi:O-antigen ligase